MLYVYYTIKIVIHIIYSGFGFRVLEILGVTIILLDVRVLAAVIILIIIIVSSKQINWNES